MATCRCPRSGRKGAKMARFPACFLKQQRQDVPTKWGHLGPIFHCPEGSTGSSNGPNPALEALEPSQGHASPGPGPSIGRPAQPGASLSQGNHNV
jgi:hypothetical protein